MTSTSGCSRSEPQPEPGPTPLRLVTWKPNQPDLWQGVYRRFQERNPDLGLVVETGPGHAGSRGGKKPTLLEFNGGYLEVVSGAEALG